MRAITGQSVLQKDKIFRWVGGVGAACLLGACGGGSSSSPAPLALNSPAATIGTPQVAKGSISGFGSVFVNGVEWETDDCRVSIDGAPGDESQLKVGDIVQVKGTIDDDGTATCETMEYDAEIEGVVEEIGPSNVIVLGLRVDVTADTVFDSDLATRDLTGLMVGDYVEISAFSSPDGYIATRIDVETNDGESEIYGRITELDTTASTFRILELTVDYSSATLDDFNGKEISNGDYVEVAGTTFASGELIATRIEYEDNNPYDEESGDEFEIEGILAIDPDGSLSVNGTRFTLAPEVTYQYGNDSDLVDGRRVELEGRVRASGSLEVYEVKFRLASTVELTAPLNGPASDGVISILGLDITVTEATQFEDDSETNETYFDLTDLVEFDWVEIKAYRNQQGNLIATRIQREDPDETVEIEAAFSETSADRIILDIGLQVVVTDNTRLPNGFDSRSAFFDVLVQGQELEIEGREQRLLDGTVEVIADELSIDD